MKIKAHLVDLSVRVGHELLTVEHNARGVHAVRRHAGGLRLLVRGLERALVAALRDLEGRLELGVDGGLRGEGRLRGLALGDLGPRVVALGGLGERRLERHEVL